jgi:hypothetical protein
MTGTNCDLFTHKQSRSYLNHLVQVNSHIATRLSVLGATVSLSLSLLAVVFPVIQSRNISVGIATTYGLNGPGVESGWERGFPHPSRLTLEPTQPLIQSYRVPFSGVKWSVRGVNHPSPSSAEVKVRVELYLYSPSGPSLSVLGQTLPIYLFPVI